jgi:hypothetical protein
MAQDLVAKKCEIIDNEEELDQMTLKHYLNMYNMPLFEQSMKAVLELTEVAVDKATRRERIRKKEKVKGREGGGEGKSKPKKNAKQAGRSVKSKALNLEKQKVKQEKVKKMSSKTMKDVQKVAPHCAMV